jgi:predicted nucleic acid-binding protein
VTAVVDASALVAFLIDDEGADGSWARDVLSDGAMLGPELILVESSNIIRRLELIGHMTTSAASVAHRDLVEHEVEVHPFAPFADRIWELRNNLTAYDAWYVALAEALDCPLVTLDRRLSRATGPTCEIVTPP